MNASNIEAAYKAANSKTFRKAAAYITKKYVSAAPNKPALTSSARQVISDITAIDMNTGANLVKNKYIGIGFILGVSSVVLIYKINKKLKGSK